MDDRAQLAPRWWWATPMNTGLYAGGMYSYRQPWDGAAPPSVSRVGQIWYLGTLTQPLCSDYSIANDSTASGISYRKGIIVWESWKRFGISVGFVCSR
jgi:hypothetical protein